MVVLDAGDNIKHATLWWQETFLHHRAGSQDTFVEKCLIGCLEQPWFIQVIFLLE